MQPTSLIFLQQTQQYCESLKKRLCVLCKKPFSLFKIYFPDIPCVNCRLKCYFMKLNLTFWYLRRTVWHLFYRRPLQKPVWKGSRPALNLQKKFQMALDSYYLSTYFVKEMFGTHWRVMKYINYSFLDALASLEEPFVTDSLIGFREMSTSPLIFSQYDYFRENIWRLSSVQFHFWYTGCLF